MDLTSIILGGIAAIGAWLVWVLFKKKTETDGGNGGTPTPDNPGDDTGDSPIPDTPVTPVAPCILGNGTITNVGDVVAGDRVITYTVTGLTQQTGYNKLCEADKAIVNKWISDHTVVTPPTPDEPPVDVSDKTLAGSSTPEEDITLGWDSGGIIGTFKHRAGMNNGVYQSDSGVIAIEITKFTGVVKSGTSGTTFYILRNDVGGLESSASYQSPGTIWVMAGYGSGAVPFGTQNWLDYRMSGQMNSGTNMVRVKSRTAYVPYTPPSPPPGPKCGGLVTGGHIGADCKLYCDAGYHLTADGKACVKGDEPHQIW